MGPPRRKTIRLPSEAYRQSGSAWLVTIATVNRVHAFSDPIFGGFVASVFESRAEEMDIGLDVYCLMPDHAHMILQVRTTSIIDYLQDVKSRSTRAWWGFGGSQSLWQRSFHDEGIRDLYDYQRSVTYVLNNPVKAQLVSDWQFYDLIGGSIVE